MRISGESARRIRTRGKYSPKEKILKGELLGDVVEEITGEDLKIHRFNFTRRKNHGVHENCEHEAKAYAGRFLIGRAKTSWLGSEIEYRRILRQRMRIFLRRNNAKASIIAIDEAKGTISRVYEIMWQTGVLRVTEHVYFKKFELLKQSTKPCQ